MAERRSPVCTDSFGQNGLFYGCGAAFRGSFYASPEDRAANIETRTRWIVLFYVPLIPLGTYRLIRVKEMVSLRGQLVTRTALVSEEPLAWGQIARVWAISLLIAMTIVFLCRWWISS
jgi:hypothetical protein